MHQARGRNGVSTLNPGVGRKTLGIYMTPNGSSTVQKEALRMKTKKWSKNMVKKYISKYDSAMAYKCSLLPAVEYPLRLTTLTKGACREIKGYTNSAFLNKLGARKTLSRDIMYGPLRYCTLRYRELYVTFDIQKFKCSLDINTNKMKQVKYKE